MRLATSVLVLLLVGGASTASAQGASWGIKGGVNFANLHFEDADDDA